MTWAYAENSTHSDFPRYDRDLMTMYNRIVAATNAKIDTNDRIFGVIPAGTAVQNARTSYIEDNLTEIEGNKAFVFKPMASNLYGFRHNFAAGTLNSDLNSVSFDMYVGTGDEGNYVIKMWMYYENGGNREVTVAGTGNTVALDTFANYRF